MALIKAAEESMAAVAAPVLAVALRKLPPIHTSEARDLIDYHSLEADLREAVRHVLARRPAGLEIFRLLLRAEKAFVDVIGTHEAPISLLQFIAAQKDLALLLEDVCSRGDHSSGSRDAAESNDQRSDHRNHDRCGDGLFEEIRCLLMECAACGSDEEVAEGGHVGILLRSLHQCEQRLLESHQRDTFDELAGKTFLGFISHEGRITEIEAVSSDAGRHAAGALPHRLIQLVVLIARDRLSQGGASSGTNKDGLMRELEAVLKDDLLACRWRLQVEMHACLPVEELGYRDFRHLVMQAKAYIEGPHPLEFLPSLSLVNVARDLAASGHGAPDESRVASLAADAAARIQAAPLLVDLGGWLDWETSFQPALGALKTLIMGCADLKGGGAAAATAPGVGGGGGGGVCGGGESDQDTWQIVEVKLGSFMKVPRASPTLEASLAAAVPHRPLDAAAAAVGIVTSLGGAASEDSAQRLRPLAAHVKSQLETLDVLQAAVFVFCTLKSMPPGLLRSSLAEPLLLLFLQPYLGAKCLDLGGSANACSKEEALLKLCICYEDYSMLSHVGRRIGKSLWAHPEIDPLAISRMLTLDGKHLERVPQARAPPARAIDYAELEASLKTGGRPEHRPDHLDDGQASEHAPHMPHTTTHQQVYTLKAPSAASHGESTVHPETASVCADVHAKLGVGLDLKLGSAEAKVRLEMSVCNPPCELPCL
jgi:hypothetical protein